MAIYKGGIPSQGFSGTFPKEESQGPMFQPDPTSGEVGMTKGGPAVNSGSSNEGLVGQAGYNAPDEQREGSMKVVNLEDIKSTV
jgi:hypothetical protein